MTCLDRYDIAAHALNSGGRTLGSKLPAFATRGAFDNEELVVIEGSKTDPWRSTPENWRNAKNAAFHGKKTVPDDIRAAC